MRRGAHSNLSLGKAVGGVAHTTVARWRGGAKPHGKTARLLAAHFNLPVEILLDDKAELPLDPALVDYARNHPEQIVAGVAAVQKNIAALDLPAMLRAIEAMQEQLNALKIQISSAAKK